MASLRREEPGAVLEEDGAAVHSRDLVGAETWIA
jgi:hypothetical protein